MDIKYCYVTHCSIFIKRASSDKSILNIDNIFASLKSKFIKENEANTIVEALEDLKNNKVVIVVDDENRENEGDFIFPAEKYSDYLWQPMVEV